MCLEVAVSRKRKERKSPGEESFLKGTRGFPQRVMSLGHIGVAVTLDALAPGPGWLVAARMESAASLLSPAAREDAAGARRVL